MEILWINCNVLLPLNRGGNIRTFNILKKLNLEHKVTYLSYLDDSHLSEDEIKEGMEPCCSELIFLKKRWERKFSLPFYMSLIQNTFSPYPYVISKYRSREMRDLVMTTIEKNSYDVIICDFLFSSIFLPEEFRPRSILFQHNVESVIWERHFRNQGNPLKKGYLYMQWKKLLNYEKNICPEFKGCITVSREDEKIIRDFGAERTCVISTGVDTKFFSPLDLEEKPYDLVFTGSMDWIPNEDSVIYFVQSIFPRIKRAVPQATLTVVGRDPSPRVRSLAERDNSIEVTGTVDDVRPYMDRAAVFIVPIRIGGGTRLKIFEAMSMRKAVVSTSVGAEGLELDNGSNIIIADDEDSFAENTIELLMNAEKRRGIGARARELMKSKFDWAVVGKEFTQFCSEFSNIN